MLTQQQLNRVRQMREENPYLALKTAVEIARYEERKSTRYPFLNEMATYPTPDDPPLVGKVKGVTITVELKHDEDAKPGDDDVTGWFTDDYEPGCIKNTRRNWGTDYKWYHPANSRLSDDSGWQWYWKHEGASKSAARDFVRQLIEQDMRVDAERTYYEMHVTLEVKGRQLAENWLGWIDVGDDPGESRAYLIETAEDQIAECFPQAGQNIDKKIQRAEEQLKALRKARKVFKKGNKR